MRTFTFSGVLAAVAAGLALALCAAASSDAGGPSSMCNGACRAAYAAIARAFPHDTGNALAPAIVKTPGFSYRELERALHVPSGAQIRTEWRRECNARFPTSQAKAAWCFRLILGP
jgi:hypothetical protein